MSVEHAPPVRTAALAVLPCADLEASVDFWRRLGLAPIGADRGYRILAGHGVEVHLNGDLPPGWLVRERNPCGVYLRVEAVDALARAFGEGLIHPPKAQLWGMYEFAVSDPDSALVRVGWPTGGTGA